MSERPVLFVFAKEPRAGAVKTRLCPPLMPADAADCQRAFTADLVARLAARFCTSSAAHVAARVTVRLAAAPDGDAPWLRDLACRTGIELVWQGDGDLGARMERALAGACNEGGAALVVGSDLPDLPFTAIEAALAAISEELVAIGPCPDGGYYLIGCRRSVPPVFRLEAAWGGEEVLEETLRRLDRAGRAFRLLERREDIDDPGALVRIARRLLTSPALRRELPETTRTLARLRVQGVPV
jgi:rSAM/selenodomain-associated transferase 1